MFSGKQTGSSVPLVIDVAGRSITEVSQVPGGGRDVAALTADNNRLVSLNGIHSFASLIQLSVCSNSLVHISTVSSLTRLVTLNLQNNSITAINGLDSLTQLQWLGLAGNSIKVMSGLSCNTKLAHLDLSDNCITELGNISMLHNLKTLLLHGNAVTSLKSIPECFPPSLTTLSLAENHVQDLNEVSFLSALPELSEVSVMGNPCVSLTDHTMLFDYRPYVVYWCPRVSTLDGITITAEEKLRSVSLFRSDHAYPFGLGQHQSLVHYLLTACPLPALNNQLYALPAQSMSFDPSSHALLTQALSLENPQQKAEVMQKLRVLQVLEQMISQQENLLNTQPQQQQQKQPSQNPQSQPEAHTNTENCLKNDDHSLVSQSHTSYHRLGSQNEDLVNESLNSSLAGGAGVTGVTGGVESVRGDGVEEETVMGMESEGVMGVGSEVVESDVIKPQPSLPFHIVPSGCIQSVEEGESGRRAVRLAWTERGREEREGGGEEGGADEGEGRGKEVGAEEVEGEAKGRENVRGRGRRTEMDTNTDIGEPDFDALISVSSSQSTLSVETLPSNVDNLTSLSLHPPADVGTTTSGNEIPGMGTGTAIPGNEISGMSLCTATHVETHPSGGEAGVKTETSASDDVTANSEVHVSMASHSSPTLHSKSSQPTSSVPTLHPTTTSASRGSAAISLRLPGVSSSAVVGRDYTNISLQARNIDLGSGPLKHTTEEDKCLFVASDPSFEDAAENTMSHNPIEIKYSSPVDPPTLLADELVMSDLATLSTDTLESDTQFLPVLGNRVETSPAREWDLSSLASSLSQAYGIADLSERASLLATLAVRQPHEYDIDTMMYDIGEKDIEGKGTMRESQLDSTVESVSCSTHVEREREEGDRGGREEGGLEQGGKKVEGEEEGGVDTGEMEGGKEVEMAGVSAKELCRVIGEVPPLRVSEGGIAERQTQQNDGPKTAKALKMRPPSPSYHDAVLTIQAAMRGCLCRKYVRLHRTRERAATTIQATWRGCRSRRRDPVVKSVRQELSRKKAESYITTMYLQLNGCREEMAHQAQILQLQEETIASLIQEVESLQVWRRGMEEKTLRKAATTIQRYWKGYRARKNYRVNLGSHQPRSVDSLWSLCLELREQVKNLEGTVASLQESRSHRGRITAPSEPVAVSLPAPSQLTMCKHSPDTILLQWRVSEGLSAASLLGYRVVVNGVEEGMVGPTKNRAYIQGLDTSSMYRISVRAVFDLGESEDSNTLLVASVDPQTGDEKRAPTPRNSHDKEVVSLPRSLQPPLPSQPPVLVARTSSTLSKSESCLTLKTTSVASSNSNDKRSVSVNQLVDREVHQEGTSIAHQSGTSVNQLPPSFGHSTDTQPSRGVTHPHSPKPYSSDDTGPNFLPRQEIKADLATRNPGGSPSAHTAFSRDTLSVPASTAFIEPCEGSSKARILGEIPLERVQEVSTGSSDFTSSPPLLFEPQDAPTVERLCVQTRAPLTSIIEGEEKTDTVRAGMEQNVPHLPDIPVDNVKGAVRPNKTNTEVVTSVMGDVKRVRTPSPIAPRSPRLAAKFDVHTTQTKLCSNVSDGIALRVHSPNSRPNVHTPTTQLHTPQLPTHHNSDVCSQHITHQHQPCTNSDLVGQTNDVRAGPSERYLRQINLSDEAQSWEGLASRDKETAIHEGSQEMSHGMRTGMPRCRLIATTSTAAELSVQPPHQQSAIETMRHQTPNNSQTSDTLSVPPPSGHTGPAVTLPVNSDVL